MSRKPGAKMVAQLSQTIKREAEAEQSPTVPPSTVPPPTGPPPTEPPPTVPPPTVPPPEKKIKIVFDLTGGKIPQPTTPEEILSKALHSSSQQDKNYEFLKFKKNCPKLLPLVHAGLAVDLDWKRFSSLKFSSEVFFYATADKSILLSYQKFWLTCGNTCAIISYASNSCCFGLEAVRYSSLTNMWHHVYNHFLYK